MSKQPDKFLEQTCKIFQSTTYLFQLLNNAKLTQYTMLDP